MSHNINAIVKQVINEMVDKNNSNTANKDIDFSNYFSDVDMAGIEQLDLPEDDEEEIIFRDRLLSLCSDAVESLESVIHLLANDEYAINNKTKYSKMNNKLLDVCEIIRHILD